MYHNRQTSRRNLSLDAYYPGIVMLVPSLLTLVLTLDVYESHINSRTIDLYLFQQGVKWTYS